MKYNNTSRAIFINRPNRFIAEVLIDGVPTTVHVKNTGRCKELLIKGATVIVAKSDNPLRKTAYDLIAVYKEGFGLINMDSQAPNEVVREWLSTKDYDYIKPEYTMGNSRFDFYLRKGGKETFLEVKGCTLEVDGIGYFPDAPSDRAVKHLNELAMLVKEGYECIVAFVIQMEGVHKVLPNGATHKEFEVAFNKAKAAGVKIMYLGCSVKEDELVIATN